MRVTVRSMKRNLKTNDKIYTACASMKSKSVLFFSFEKVDRSAKRWEIKGRHFLNFLDTHLTTSARSTNLYRQNTQINLK